ncbi:hypothetical protein LCGC14_1485890 [marine sediment metagenome]|uniref:Uncharacterized protein n=1 Tax=marine sediment metagenome TaxID=412755 RepID=A0A0F9LNS3_9ZZZZ
MVLTLTVEKRSVTETMDKMWSIVLNLSALDGTEVVINKDFTLKYRSGQDVEEKVKALLTEMQEAIDDYKSEQAIFNHTKLDTAVTYLNNNLTG